MGAYKKRRGNAAFDWFRLVSAFWIVAIHTGPFSGINGEVDDYLTYCIGRIGVPFFLMMTGYFVLSGTGAPGNARPEEGKRKISQTLKKLGILYLAATVLYLPLTWYAGNLPRTVGEALRWAVFDGTFYHLWYLPGAMLGVVLTAGLLRHLKPQAAGLVAFCLYLLGLLGDSWYGLVRQNPVLAAFYNGVFSVCSYTRNGIFLMPVFLWMGAIQGRRRMRWSRRKSWMGFGISLAAMLAEGGITRHLGYQRHNSMYLFLPLVMYFLFDILIAGRDGRKSALAVPGRRLRKIAMYIYLLHPLCIVLIRGAAGALGVEEVFVANTLLFYLEVCGMSVAAGLFCTWLQEGLSFKNISVKDFRCGGLSVTGKNTEQKSVKGQKEPGRKERDVSEKQGLDRT